MSREKSSDTRRMFAFDTAELSDAAKLKSMIGTMLAAIILDLKEEKIVGLIWCHRRA